MQFLAMDLINYLLNRSLYDNFWLGSINYFSKDCYGSRLLNDSIEWTYVPFRLDDILRHKHSLG